MAKPLTTRAQRNALFCRAWAYARGVRQSVERDGYTLESAWLAGYRAALRDAHRNSTANRAAVAKRTGRK